MGTAGTPSSQRASRKPATHTGASTTSCTLKQGMLHPGHGVTPDTSLLTQGPAGSRALWVLQGLLWDSTHEHSCRHCPACLLASVHSTQPRSASLNVSLYSVFQAFPLESLRCWWGRPGPVWVSMAVRGCALLARGPSPALPLGCVEGGWGPSLEQLESAWLRRPAKCL